MTEHRPARRIASVTKIAAIAGALLLLACLIPEVVFGFVYIVGLVLFGWIGFLRRVNGRMDIDPSGILLGLGAILLLMFGIHLVVSRIFSNPSWTKVQTVRSVLGVVGIFIGGICLIGLGHELSWSQRSKTPWIRVRSSWEEIRASIRSKSDLKQIGLAVHNYETVNHTFPVGGTFRPDGGSGHGWMTALLPQIDQAQLYAKIRLDVPWYHSDNREEFKTRIPTYEYPLVEGMTVSDSEYAIGFFAANDRLLNANRGFKISEITDGTSNTIFAGEVKENLRPWGDVVNWRKLELGINKSANGFGGPRKNVTQFLMADGSVRTISETIDPNTLKALATPNAGDTVVDY